MKSFGFIFLLLTNSLINLNPLNNSPPLVTSLLDPMIDSIRVVPDLGVPKIKILLEPLI